MSRCLTVALALFAVGPLAADGPPDLAPNACDRPAKAIYDLHGPFAGYLRGVSDRWLKVAPAANPGMLEMFRDRDRRPYRALEPWAGEFAGKYLTAAVQVLRLTGDRALRDALAGFVREWVALQADDGYLGPWPTGSRLTGRAPNVGKGQPGDTWDAWGHYHALVGLLLWHAETGDPAALAAARKIGDLLCERFLGDKKPRLVDTGSTEMNLAPVHGLALLYRSTRDPRHLALAKQLVGEFAATGPDGKPLAGDYLRAGLAGTEFFATPKPRWESLHPILGLAELHRLTGDTSYRRAFEQLWWSIVKLDRHNNGGFSSGEQAQGNPYHPGAIETCCTIAWLAMGVEMLRLTGDSVVADELELSTLNSALGLHSPTGRWATYNTPMDGVRKASAHDIVFQAREGTPELNCCSVNAARGLGLVSDWAVMRDATGLRLNWYGPGAMTAELPSGVAVRLTQETDYPRDGRVRIAVDPAKESAFALRLRVPYWSAVTRASLNGTALGAPEAGTYLTLDRTWKPGDRVELAFDFSPHFWVGERECRGKVSAYRGPILLTWDRRFNDTAPADVPALAAGAFPGRPIEWAGSNKPILLLEVPAGGRSVRLCDFASAGHAGSPYRSWLAIDDVPAVEFSRANPLRSGRPPVPKPAAGPQPPAGGPAPNAITRGPTGGRRLALVFTGHEFAEGGDTILGELQKHRAKASFFLTGDFLANPQFQPLVRRIVDDGHYLGPHSDKHLLYCDWTPAKTTLVSKEAFVTDARANLDKIARLGIARPRYFLPPYEHSNADVARWTTELGLTLVNFTPGTRSNADYTPEGAKNFVPSQVIYDSILTRERQDPNGLGGFLLLLHVGVGPQRADKFHARFGTLLDDLASKGYQFVRVDALLEPDAAAVHVRANQVGYGPADTKVGVALSKVALPDAFAVVDASTGATVFEGKAKHLPGEVWGELPHHAELDFTAFTRPGRYRLQVGAARSLPFHVGPDALAGLPDQLLEFLRQQRCGDNPWLGATCHQHDGRTAYGPRPAGSAVDATGGWHDAGDLLKYQLTSGNATAQMLLAYVLGRSDGRRFADRVDALGKPNPNGRPDLLDEARWGLDWLLKLHPAPDQLYHQVADDRDHYGLRLPQNEAADYGWGKGGARVVYFADGRPQGLQKYQSESTGLANLAGRYAAAMGLAYQVWKDDPKERAFADRCLQAGREVYDLGRAKEGVQQGNSYKAPYRYEETTWADDMEWGAAELFRATGEARYLADARRYAALAAADTWMGQEQVKHYQYYPFMNLGHFRLHGLVDREFQTTLAGYYREGIERCVAAGRGNPYRVGVPFIWCSNNLVVALATQCDLYERMTGDRRYRAFAAGHRDWLLGRNPWGTTMLTQVGSRFPTEVHLQTTKLTGRPVRGGLVDGPVYERIFKSLRGVSITLPDPLAAFQDRRAVYHNDFHDYATNEPTMDGTASAVLLWAAAGTGK